jgi:hypothetical protein
MIKVLKSKKQRVNIFLFLTPNMISIIVKYRNIFGDIPIWVYFTKTLEEGGKMKQISIIIIVVMYMMIPIIVYCSMATDKRILRDGVEVEARVVDCYELGANGIAEKHYTVVYTNRGGNEVKATARLNNNDAEIGDVITVRYLENSPNTVYVVAPKGIAYYFFNIVIMGMMTVGYYIVHNMLKSINQKYRIL